MERDNSRPRIWGQLASGVAGNPWGEKKKRKKIGNSGNSGAEGWETAEDEGTAMSLSPKEVTRPRAVLVPPERDWDLSPGFMAAVSCGKSFSCLAAPARTPGATAVSLVPWPVPCATPSVPPSRVLVALPPPATPPRVTMPPRPPPASCPAPGWDGGDKGDKFSLSRKVRASGSARGFPGIPPWIILELQALPEPGSAGWGVARDGGVAPGCPQEMSPSLGWHSPTSPTAWGDPMDWDGSRGSQTPHAESGGTGMSPRGRGHPKVGTPGGGFSLPAPPGQEMRLFRGFFPKNLGLGTHHQRGDTTKATKRHHGLIPVTPRRQQKRGQPHGVTVTSRHKNP